MITITMMAAVEEAKGLVMLCVVGMGIGQSCELSQSPVNANSFGVVG